MSIEPGYLVTDYRGREIARCRTWHAASRIATLQADGDGRAAKVYGPGKRWLRWTCQPRAQGLKRVPAAELD